MLPGFPRWIQGAFTFSPLPLRLHTKIITQLVLTISTFTIWERLRMNSWDPVNLDDSKGTLCPIWVLTLAKPWEDQETMDSCRKTVKKATWSAQTVWITLKDNHWEYPSLLSSSSFFSEESVSTALDPVGLAAGELYSLCSRISAL
jgi:hypothetical protein